MNFKLLSIAAMILPLALSSSARANPIIQNSQTRRARLTAEIINSPQNGGTTTLREKCEALNYFMRRNEVAGYMRVTMQMGWEHEGVGDVLHPDDACAMVGVNTRLFGIF